MTNEESKAKAQTIRALLVERGVTEAMHGAIGVIEGSPTDLHTLEFARGILSASVEYLRANLENAEPGITTPMFPMEIVRVDVQALREALIEEVSALLGEFQITEVDGNMKGYGTRIFEAVVKKATR